ncbi:MAG: hypothetical protein AAGE52_29805 [Myxococcota bacterium]
MTWDVVSTALRMLLWVVLLGGVAPNLLFRRSAHDGPARVARTAILSLFATAVLWFCGQLNLGTFLASLFVYAVGAEVRHRRGVIQWVVRFLWSRFADLFYEPRPADVPAGVGILPAAETPDEEEKEASYWRRRVARTKRSITQSRAMIETGIAIGRRATATIAGSTKATRDRVQARLGARRAALFATLLASVTALLAVVLRLLRDEPINGEETNRLMHLAGWGDSQEWLPDVVFSELGAALTMSPRATATIALGAPLIFLAGWSGAHAIRRIAPATPPWLGALATSVIPAVAIVQGQTASLGLLAVALAPWLCTCAGDASRRSRRPVALLTIFAILHPLGLACGWILLAAALVSERAERTPRERLRVVALLLLPLLALVAVALGMGGIQAWSSLALSETPPRWLVIVTVASAGWLLLGGPRRRSDPVVWAGRALGAGQLALTFAAGGFDGEPKVATLPYGLEVMTTVSLTAAAADLWKLNRRARIGAVAFLAPAVVVACVLATAPQTATEERRGLSRPLLELAATMRQEHLPWNFSVVASRRALPAFVDSAWVVDASHVADAFPPQRYYFDPAQPEQIIGTRYTYVVLDGSDPDADAQAREWVDQLQALRAYPQPAPYHAWEEGNLELFLLARDPEYELQQSRAPRSASLKPLFPSPDRGSERLCFLSSFALREPRPQGGFRDDFHHR